MKLVIGGCCQGKLAYVCQETGLSEGQVADGATCDWTACQGWPVIDHLHLLIRRLLLAEVDPQLVLAQVLQRTPEVVLISDEIGYGVVPMDAFERQWREVTGRICCQLAAQATSVVRVSCGQPLYLKGDAHA